MSKLCPFCKKGVDDKDTCPHCHRVIVEKFTTNTQKSNDTYQKLEEQNRTYKAKDIHSSNESKWFDKLTPVLSGPVVFIGGLIMIAIVYLIVNAVFLGAQELYHLPGTTKLNNIEKVLDTTKSEITILEENLHGELDRIEEMKSEMSRLKSSGRIQQHNSMVNSYNFLVNRYESERQLYSDKVDFYNQRAEEYNELAKKEGKRWIIVPIPGSGRIHPQ